MTPRPPKHHRPLPTTCSRQSGLSHFLKALRHPFTQQIPVSLFESLLFIYVAYFLGFFTPFLTDYAQAFLFNSTTKVDYYDVYPPTDFYSTSWANTLPEIVRYEISQANLQEGSNCLNYSLYYNRTFTEKYPELDVYWDRSYNGIFLRNICNSTTPCWHTFVIVAGYGGECIVDQHQYACVHVLTSPPKHTPSPNP